MRKVRELLRLRLHLGLSVREAALGARVSVGAAGKLAKRTAESGLDWGRVCLLSDSELQRALYGPTTVPDGDRPEPDPIWIHTELRRPGVTLELLHLEYLEEHPTGLQYTAFCERYRRWRHSRGLSMKQFHKAGERMFSDFSGKRPTIVDRSTGEVRPVELFVAVLGASNYTFAEATRTQRVPDWIAAHTHAFAYFGGVPRVVVPDQLRSAVSRPSRREPVIQRTFSDMAAHYGTAVIPARPRRPQDKAKVEVGVQVVQRWILARIRNETFFSLDELNLRIRELLVDLNNRPMRRYGGVSRHELFEQVEQAALLPLPQASFTPSQWSYAIVQPHYHIEIANHFYSVPYQLVGEEVEARATDRTVEIICKGRSVARHRRSSEPGQKTTALEHMPPNHRAWASQSPESLIAWATELGDSCRAMMQRLLETAPNDLLGLRAGSHLRQLEQTYGAQRLEHACARALSFSACSYKPIERMLKLGLESPQDNEQNQSLTLQHCQIRGPKYYH